MKPLPIKHFSLFPPSNTLTCIVIFIMPHQCSKRNDPIRRGSKSRDGTRREGRALKGETGPKVGWSGMIAERGKEWAGRIGSRKAESRRGPTPGVAAPAEIGHPARGDNARPRKEGDAQAPGMRVTFQPHAGGGAADTANGPGVGGSGQGALQFLNDFRLILVPLLGTDGVYGNAPHGLIPHAQDMGNADGPFKQHPLG